MVHILDDFRFAGSSDSEECKNTDYFEQLCDFIGVPLKVSKSVGPTTTIEFAGTTIYTLLLWKYAFLYTSCHN